MDHDFVDRHEHHQPRRPPSSAEPSSAGPDLASQIGNRAFSTLVHRATERTQGAGPLDPEIANEIDGVRGGGRPLDDDTKVDMESHLGADLSGVRIHTDSSADSLNRAVQAEAFTTGSDVFFKSGRYAPDSTDGRRLLAHELTHVLQHSSGDAGGESRVSHPDDPHEVEARSVGDAVADSPRATALDRQVDDDELIADDDT